MNAITASYKRKRIAILSHQHKKVDLVNWAYDNQALLKQHQLHAMPSTASVLEGTLNTYVYKLPETMSGLVNMMKEGKIDLVVFIWEPVRATAYDVNFSALIEKAVELNIPVACNIPTANLVLSSLNPKNQQQEAINPVFLRPSRNAVGSDLLNVVTKN
jgi:methylglyoxal synthase